MCSQNAEMLFLGPKFQKFSGGACHRSPPNILWSVRHWDGRSIWTRESTFHAFYVNKRVGLLDKILCEMGRSRQTEWKCVMFPYKSINSHSRLASLPSGINFFCISSPIVSNIVKTSIAVMLINMEFQSKKLILKSILITPISSLYKQFISQPAGWNLRRI
jgi:hypothetical protein